MDDNRVLTFKEEINLQYNRNNDLYLFSDDVIKEAQKKIFEGVGIPRHILEEAPIKLHTDYTLRRFKYVVGELDTKIRYPRPQKKQKPLIKESVDWLKEGF